MLHPGSWFSDAGAEVDLRPGGAITLTWREHGTLLGRIDVVEPPHRLVARWSEAPDVEPAPGNQTTIEFTVRPDGAGSVLRVVESGFDTLALPPEEQARRRAGNVEGWELELAELVAYIPSTDVS